MGVGYSSGFICVGGEFTIQLCDGFRGKTVLGVRKSMVFCRMREGLEDWKLWKVQDRRVESRDFLFFYF